MILENEAKFVSHEETNVKIEQEKFIWSLSENILAFQDPKIVAEIINFALELEQKQLPYIKINSQNPWANFLSIPSFGNINYGSLDCFSTVYMFLRKLHAQFPEQFSNLHLSDQIQLIQGYTFEYAIKNNLLNEQYNLETFEQNTSNSNCFFIFTSRKTEENPNLGLKKVGARHLMIGVRDEIRNFRLLHNNNSKFGFVVESYKDVPKYLNFERRRIFTL
jgi:hypothetical protein